MSGSGEVVFTWMLAKESPIQAEETAATITAANRPHPTAGRGASIQRERSVRVRVGAVSTRPVGCSIRPVELQKGPFDINTTHDQYRVSGYRFTYRAYSYHFNSLTNAFFQRLRKTIKSICRQPNSFHQVDHPSTSLSLISRTLPTCHCLAFRLHRYHK